MNLASVLINAGEFAHSISMVVRVGIVTYYHYSITQLQALDILHGLDIGGYDVLIDKQSDPFVLKLLGV